MSTIKQIEEAIEQLPPEELAKFRAWFSEYDSERWDRQIEQELPLDDLTVAEEALADLRQGRCRDL